MKLNKTFSKTVSNKFHEKYHDFTLAIFFFFFGLWEKNDSSTPKKVLENTNEGTCGYLRYVNLLICLRWSVASFWRVIRNFFLAWLFFNVRNKGITTKLAEKMGREHHVGQSSSNAHTALL